jgi:superfamily II DNA or RNA helicase
MNLIKIANDYSYLISDDNHVKTELWNRLRFRDKNYYHNRAYKMRRWDGYINFFDLQSGKFLTGLLPEVAAVLRYCKVQYNVEDNRQKTQFLYESINDQFLNQWLPEKHDKITLYDYQVELVNQVIKHRRGIIYAPTAAGKSKTMLGILKCIQSDIPTLILQNKVSLAKQNYDEFNLWGIKNLGCLWGKNVDPQTITVATFQSIHKIEKILPTIKCVIVDEIHEGMSALPKKVYKRLKSADIRVAVSATPFKFGGSDNVQKFEVRGFFGPVLKIKSSEKGVLTTSDLQERGILSSSKCIFYNIKEPKIPHDIYIDAVTRGIAESYFFHNVVKKLAKKQSGRTLILVDRIAHGDALNVLLPGSLWIQGKDDENTRKDVIEKLQKSKNVIAIATQQILNTGVNFHIHNLINAAGGKAEHQIIQRIGRGLRVKDDKETLNYYDFVFDINDYLLNHSFKRINVLKSEGHDVQIKDIDF